MEIIVSDKLLYKSQPKQTQFHKLIENRAVTNKEYFLFGGARGGGKSECLRWQAISDCLETPHIRTLILRSSYPELDKTHIARINQQLPPGLGKYNEQKKLYTFANGSVIQFGHGDNKRDFKKYLSDEYEAMFIDEMTTIPFDFLLLLFSSLRTTKDFKPYVAAGTNPGNISHIYVKSFFIDKDFGTKFPDMSSEYDPNKVEFLQSLIYDNPILIDNDPSYLRRLKQLSPNDRKRFLEGNWDVFEGQFFENLNREIHIITPDEPERNEVRWGIGLDYGTVSCAEMGYMSRDKRLTITNEWTEIGKTTTEKAKSFSNWLDLVCSEHRISRGEVEIYADTNMFALQREMDDRKTPAQTFKEHNINLRIVSKKSPDNRKFRVFANDLVKDLLNWKKDDYGLWVSRPKLNFWKGRAEKLLGTMPLLQIDPNNDSDLLESDIDHWYDALKYLAINLMYPRKQEDEKSIVSKLISLAKAD